MSKHRFKSKNRGQSSTPTQRAALRVMASLSNPQEVEAFFMEAGIPTDRAAIVLSDLEVFNPVRPDRMSFSITVGNAVIDADFNVSDTLRMARLGAQSLNPVYGSAKALSRSASTEIIRLFESGDIASPDNVMLATCCAALMVTLHLPIGELLSGNINWCNFQSIPSTDGGQDMRMDLGRVEAKAPSRAASSQLH